MENAKIPLVSFKPDVRKAPDKAIRPHLEHWRPFSSNALSIYPQRCGSRFVLAAVAEGILPKPRVRNRLAGSGVPTFRGIFNIGWFSHEGVGTLAIPRILCLVLAIMRVIAGRWIRRAKKI